MREGVQITKFKIAVESVDRETATFRNSCYFRFRNPSPPSFSFSSFSVRFSDPLLESAMESACALLPANWEKKEREMEESPHVPGSGRKPTIRNPNYDETAELKETVNSIRNSVNKFSSLIKKPPNRRISPPLNWFPRKKTDSFLKRKLRQLQEGGGMSLSLVETLGNANPHYSRIAREKIAAQEAANKAMEARKAAMVEASWCRILQAARIQRKDAESNLEKAEQCALRAFEEAKLTGVMMFDKPDCPRRPCEVQSSSSANGGKSAHTINASFETEFEVDREVAAAVRKALIVLTNCPSSSNGEFRELLRKIRQNPDDYEAAQDSLTVSLQFDCEQTGVETESNVASTEISENHNSISHRKSNFGIVSDCHENNFSISTDDLVKRMVYRLKELQEDELSSLATIVATCGLNAALHEMQRSEDYDAQGGPQRRSNINQFAYASKKNNEDIADMPSLDKFLVKHVSRLEREVQEAQISKKNEEFKKDRQLEKVEPLDEILVKHQSKLEKAKQAIVLENPEFLIPKREKHVENIENLNETLVKHQPKLGRVKLEASQNLENSIKHSNARREARERELQEAWGGLSLGNSLKPHLSKLEKVKDAWRRAEEEVKTSGRSF